MTFPIVVPEATPTEEVAPPHTVWHRDFTLLWSGAATSQLGTISAATAGPLLALSLTGSPVFAGWVTAANTIPNLLLQLPAGLLVDRFDRRRIMLFCQLARLVVTSLLIGGLFMVGFPEYLLIGAAIADGVFAAFYTIAEIAAVQRVVPREILQDSMAKNEARQHIAHLLGRPLGGFLISLNRSLPYVLDAMTSILSIVTLLMLKSRNFLPVPDDPAQPAGAKSRTRPVGGIKAGLLLLVRDRFLLSVLVVCTVSNFLFQTVILLLVVMAEAQGMSSSLIGLLLATSGASGFVGAMVAPWLLTRVKTPQAMIVACIWGWLPLTLIVALSTQPAVGMVAWGLCSFMGAHMNVALAIYQATHVPEDLLGRVTSLTRFLSSGAVPLGAISAGYIISALHPRGAAVLVVIAMSLVATAPLTARSAKAIWTKTASTKTAAKTARSAQTAWTALAAIAARVALTAWAVSADLVACIALAAFTPNTGFVVLAVCIICAVPATRAIRAARQEEVEEAKEPAVIHA